MDAFFWLVLDLCFSQHIRRYGPAITYSPQDDITMLPQCIGCSSDTYTALLTLPIWGERLLVEVGEGSKAGTKERIGKQYSDAANLMGAPAISLLISGLTSEQPKATHQLSDQRIKLKTLKLPICDKCSEDMPRKLIPLKEVPLVCSKDVRRSLFFNGHIAIEVSAKEIKLCFKNQKLAAELRETKRKEANG